MEWQPIETAPKDGTEIIVRDGVGGVHGAKWTTHRGRTDWFHHRNLGWLPSASWWMPLPEPPKVGAGKTAREPSRYDPTGLRK